MAQKIRIINIGFISIFCILIIIGLLLRSEVANNKENGFIRFFPPHLVDQNFIVDIRHNSFYISGMTSNRVYLGNITDPATYLSISTYLPSDTASVKINVPNDKLLAWRRTRLVIDSPAIYMYDGTTGSFLQGNFNSQKMSHSQVDSVQFSKAVILSGCSMIVRNFDVNKQQNVLSKRYTEHTKHLENYILEKQTDGIFCTDGMLEYEPSSDRLFYTFYYRNQFICLDTNLNLLYKGKTIDTVSTARLNVVSINNSQDRTLASPPLNVNLKSFVSDSLLYINSALRANNEAKNTFEESSVIDIYNGNTGKYKFSIHIPQYKENKFFEFGVYKNKLVGLYDHYLVFYTLNF